MGTLIIAGQLILSLSILIVLHEGGHFLPAKLFGARVEKFYLFFDPWFELFKFKRGDTEYGIGWLPLGGYVKISGMIDESFDKEQMEQEPQPWEFRSKPAWQRLIIMLGGVTVNFILGFIIFAGMLYTWGETFIPTANVTHGIHADSLGQVIGLQNGDKVLKVGDLTLDRFNPLTVKKEIIVNNAPTITIDRNGSQKVLNVPDNFAQVLSSRADRDKRLYSPRLPFIAGEIIKGSPAEKAGLMIDDQIIEHDSVATPYFRDFFNKTKKAKNHNIVVTVLRGNSKKYLNLVTDEDHLIGVRPKGMTHFYDSDTIKYSFLESIPAGVKKGWETLTDQIKAFGQMFAGKISAKDNVGSVFTIANAFGDTWEWERFWNLTGVLSMILAFMNLLPIPALDGGHVMFLLYEVISGRKPNDTVVEYATLAGFILLVILMISVLGLDIWNNFIR